MLFLNGFDGNATDLLLGNVDSVSDFFDYRSRAARLHFDLDSHTDIKKASDLGTYCVGKEYKMIGAHHPCIP